MTRFATRFALYLRLIRFERPIGTLLLLWPTWWGLWLASSGRPSLLNVVVFSIGVFLMRSAGCAINDYADRHIDVHVERTRDRVLASGLLGENEALWLALLLSVVAFALVLLTNEFTVLLSVAGILIAACYPFLKRHTHLPQVGLGIAFSWGIPMSFAAEQNSVPAQAWLLFFAAVVWSVVYDTFYAMVDRDDDIRIGVKSTAILFGESDRPITATLQLLTLLLLLLCGRQFELGPVFYAALGIGTLLFGYQQWLIREREREPCFAAFLNNNLFGFAIFAGIAFDFVLR